jgi:hypothetical protein
MFSQALRLDPFVQNGKSAISERHTKESTVNQRTSNPPTLKAPESGVTIETHGTDYERKLAALWREWTFGRIAITPGQSAP